MPADRVLTCVYCGHEYPAGTPASVCGTPASGEQVQVLTDHIRVCEKHPMRVLERENAAMRELLGRIRDWDQLPQTGDGQYWITEIDKVLS